MFQESADESKTEREDDVVYFIGEHDSSSWAGLMDNDEAMTEEEIREFIRQASIKMYNRLRGLPFKSSDVPMSFVGQRNLRNIYDLEHRSTPTQPEHHKDTLPSSLDGPRQKLDDSTFGSSSGYKRVSFFCENTKAQAKARIDRQISHGRVLRTTVLQRGELQPPCCSPLCPNGKIVPDSCQYYILEWSSSASSSHYIYGITPEYFCAECFHKLYATSVPSRSALSFTRPVTSSKVARSSVSHSKMQEELLDKTCLRQAIHLDGVSHESVLEAARNLYPRIATLSTSSTPGSLQKNNESTCTEPQTPTDRATEDPQEYSASVSCRNLKRVEIDTIVEYISRYDRLRNSKIAALVTSDSSTGSPTSSDSHIEAPTDQNALSILSSTGSDNTSTSGRTCFDETVPEDSDSDEMGMPSSPAQENPARYNLGPGTRKEASKIKYNRRSSSTSSLKLRRPPYLEALRERYKKQGLTRYDRIKYLRQQRLAIPSVRRQLFPRNICVRSHTAPVSSAPQVIDKTRICICRESIRPLNIPPPIMTEDRIGGTISPSKGDLCEQEQIITCTAEFCPIKTFHVRCIKKFPSSAVPLAQLMSTSRTPQIASPTSSLSENGNEWYCEYCYGHLSSSASLSHELPAGRLFGVRKVCSETGNPGDTEVDRQNDIDNAQEFARYGMIEPGCENELGWGVPINGRPGKGHGIEGQCSSVKE